MKFRNELKHLQNYKTKNSVLTKSYLKSARLFFGPQRVYGKPTTDLLVITEHLFMLYLFKALCRNMVHNLTFITRDTFPVFDPLVIPTVKLVQKLAHWRLMDRFVWPKAAYPDDLDKEFGTFCMLLHQFFLQLE